MLDDSLHAKSTLFNEIISNAWSVDAKVLEPFIEPISLRISLLADMIISGKLQITLFKADSLA